MRCSATYLEASSRRSFMLIPITASPLESCFFSSSTNAGT